MTATPGPDQIEYLFVSRGFSGGFSGGGWRVVVLVRVREWLFRRAGFVSIRRIGATLSVPRGDSRFGMSVRSLDQLPSGGGPGLDRRRAVDLGGCRCPVDARSRHEQRPDLTERLWSFRFDTVALEAQRWLDERV